MYSFFPDPLPLLLRFIHGTLPGYYGEQYWQMSNYARKRGKKNCWSLRFTGELKNASGRAGALTTGGITRRQRSPAAADVDHPATRRFRAFSDDHRQTS